MFDEPKDIFDAVDKAPVASAPPAAPVVMEAQASAPIAPPPTRLPPTYGMGSLPPAEHEGRGGKMKFVVIIVGVLLLFGVSGYFAYRIMVQPAAEGSVVDAVPDTGVTDDDTENDATIPSSNSGTMPSSDDENDAPATVPAATITTNPASLLDSDGDGLTNARELEVGTSVTKADTDGDGLGDREEVEVYGTEPRKPDTDGDGYMDGQEVSGGYNPNGEGKLFTIPEGN